MNLIEEIAGEICRIVLPIGEEVFFGDPKSNVAVCTLSSINLLREISNSDIIGRVAIAGRLLSENKGIDSLVQSVTSNKRIDTIILCGKDVIGHKSGDALLCLYRNGMDANHRIIGSSSPHPVLAITKKQVSEFQGQVKIVNKIGETRIPKLGEIIGSLRQAQ